MLLTVTAPAAVMMTDAVVLPDVAPVQAMLTPVTVPAVPPVVVLIKTLLASGLEAPLEIEEVEPNDWLLAVKLPPPVLTGLSMVMPAGSVVVMETSPPPVVMEPEFELVNRLKVAVPVGATTVKFP